nr:T9SS type A sorting domain-containing protein [Bernardetia litoralis]
MHRQAISMNEKTTSINLPKISAGVYVVQIVSEGKVYTKQLIIQ